MSKVTTLVILVLSVFLFQSCSEDALLSTPAEDLLDINTSANARSMNGNAGDFCIDISEFDELYCVYYYYDAGDSPKSRHYTFSSTNLGECLQATTYLQNDPNVTIVSFCGRC